MTSAAEKGTLDDEMAALLLERSSMLRTGVRFADGTELSLKDSCLVDIDDIDDIATPVVPVFPDGGVGGDGGDGGDGGAAVVARPAGAAPASDVLDDSQFDSSDDSAGEPPGGPEEPPGEPGDPTGGEPGDSPGGSPTLVLPGVPPPRVVLLGWSSILSRPGLLAYIACADGSLRSEFDGCGHHNTSKPILLGVTASFTDPLKEPRKTQP